MTDVVACTLLVGAVIAISTAVVARLARLNRWDVSAMAGLFASTAAILTVVGPLVSHGEYDDYQLFLAATGRSETAHERPLYEWCFASKPDFAAGFPIHALLASTLPAFAYLVARRAGAGLREAVWAGGIVVCTGSVLTYGAGFNEFVPFAVGVALTTLLVDAATAEASVPGIIARCGAALLAGIWTLAVATLRAEGPLLLLIIPIALVLDTRNRTRAFVSALFGAWLVPLVVGRAFLAGAGTDFLKKFWRYGPDAARWLPVGVLVAVVFWLGLRGGRQRGPWILRLRSAPITQRLALTIALVAALLLSNWLSTNGLLAWLVGFYWYWRHFKLPAGTFLVSTAYLLLYAGLGDASRHQLVLLPLVLPLGIRGLSRMATTRPELARRWLRAGVACSLLGALIMVPLFKFAPKQAEFEELRRADRSGGTVWYMPYTGFGVWPEQSLMASLNPAWNVVELSPPRGCPRGLFRAIGRLHEQCVSNADTLARCERAVASARGDWVLAAVKAMGETDVSNIGLAGPEFPAVPSARSGKTNWIFKQFWTRRSFIGSLVQDFPPQRLTEFGHFDPAGLVLRIPVESETAGKSLVRVEVRPPDEGEAECRAIAQRPEGALLFRWVEGHRTVRRRDK